MSLWLYRVYQRVDKGARFKPRLKTQPYCQGLLGDIDYSGPIGVLLGPIP